MATSEHGGGGDYAHAGGGYKVLICISNIYEQYLVTLVVVDEDSHHAKACSIVRLLQHKVKQTKN